jgi:hypothetical protein
MTLRQLASGSGCLFLDCLDPEDGGNTTFRNIGNRASYRIKYLIFIKAGDKNSSYISCVGRAFLAF